MSFPDNKLFWQEGASQVDTSIILSFEDMNYKVESASKLLLVSGTYVTFYSETDNLKNILLKAELQKKDVEKGSKMQHEQIHK